MKYMHSRWFWGILFIIAFWGGFSIAVVGISDDMFSTFFSEKSENILDDGRKQRVHQSEFVSKATLEKIFASIKIPVPSEPIALTVNHHLLYSSAIAKTLMYVQSSQPKQIILIGPDHLNRGKQNISTTLYNWEWHNNSIQVDKDSIEKLQKTTNISIDPNVFDSEHSVGNIIPFLQKILPDTKIIPLTIKEQTSHEEIENLFSGLIKLSDENIPLIASIDFNHNTPTFIQKFQDEKIHRILANQSLSSIKNLNIDSHRSLELLIRYAKHHQAKKWTPLHTHSANEITNNQESFENVSYINGIYTSETPKTYTGFTLFFGGDLMFDRYIRKNIEKHGFDSIFEDVKILFQGIDLQIANLEGSITNLPPIRLHPDAVRFTFEENTAEKLKQHGFDLVSLGNNHTLDFGESGLTMTKDILQKANIGYFGDTLNRKDLSLIREVDGIKIGFIAYHSLFRPSLESIEIEIKKLRPQVDILIAFNHWGNEYQEIHSPSQSQVAHTMIDQGVDIVIGAHPHVIQDIEIYQGKPIFYSLGNFVFDQARSETKRGYTVGIVKKQDQIDFHIFPIQIDQYKTKLLYGEERKKILQYLADISKKANNTNIPISSGVFSLPIQK